MNGFETKGLNEDTFGEKSSLSGLKTFDAFRESKTPPHPGTRNCQEQAVTTAKCSFLYSSGLQFIPNLLYEADKCPFSTS